MRNANSKFPAWPAAILLTFLILAALAAALWGLAGWALGASLGGNIIVLLWFLIRARSRNSELQKTRSLPRARPTRRHRLLAQLRDVRDAVGSLPDAVVLFDPQGRVRWFNTAASRLLGLQRRHTGHSLAGQLAGSELGAWLLADTHQPAADMPAPADVSLRLGVMIMPFGSQLRLLLARDISTLSRLEQVRRDFVANVSHELRTPLTVIHGYLEVLDPADAPELAPVLAEMRLQSQRMGQIVEDLLTLSRLETREALPDEAIVMPPLLETLRREAAALSQGRHVITVAATTHANLRGSLHDLHSAFSNLVSNAVRYTPSGGEIVIGWRQTADGGAAFSVRDSGLGISAEHLSRLTERFYRVSSSRSRESGGTGLGLSIVKHVLNLHQARLLVESEPGHGSTFSCMLDASRVLPPGSGDAREDNVVVD
ncbi:MAG: phosphate regulon sensor histidine kinase PhoR [Burkholderiaceae bacterium]